MRTELVIAVLLGGLGTYLIRLLPILAGDRLGGRLRSPRLHRFLLALGPAAIAALLMLSLKDMLPASGQPLGPAMLALSLGAAAVLSAQRLTRSPALATLAGALTVALIHALKIS